MVTNHVEVELSQGSERATTDDRNEGQVNRDGEGVAKQEPGNQNTKSRLSALDNVSERHRNLRHTHSGSHMPDCMRHSHLPNKQTNKITTQQFQGTLKSEFYHS